MRSALAGRRSVPDLGDAALAPLEAIIRGLEQEIVLGSLHPRERLVEDHLMVRFGAKRYVVREALAELARMGLVERLPNKGASVVDLKPAQVEQIYEMRDLLEAAAIKRIPLPASPTLVAQLKRLQTRHDAAAAKRDLRALFRLNIEFHRAVFSACSNPHLSSAIDEYGQRAHAVRSFAITNPACLAKAQRDHWAIIEAVSSGDRPQLLKISSQHIRAAVDSYTEAYRRRFGAEPPVAISSS